MIDVLIARDGDAYRLYSAPGSWRGPLGSHADRRGDVARVDRPDLEDLEGHMFATDSPYEHRPLPDGGVEIKAAGRSAVCLGIWLQGLLPR